MKLAIMHICIQKLNKGQSHYTLPGGAYSCSLQLSINRTLCDCKVLTEYINSDAFA